MSFPISKLLQFCDTIDKQIAELRRQVKVLRRQVQNVALNQQLKSPIYYDFPPSKAPEENTDELDPEFLKALEEAKRQVAKNPQLWGVT